MVNFLTKWIPGLSEMSAPLRAQRKDQNEWQWGSEQDQAWMELKAVVTTEPVLQYYNPNRLMLLSSNASKGGLGAVIVQLHDDKWLPIAYALRAMTSAETCYAQLEKELLEIVFACE